MGKKQAASDSATHGDKKPNVEQLLGQLEEIVRQLERGDLGLGESLTSYERGVKLLRQCHDFLTKAERRIELLSGVDADGNPLTTALDDSRLAQDEST